MASRLFTPSIARGGAASLRAPLRAQRSLIAPKRFNSTTVNVKDARLVEHEHAKEHAAKSAELWRKISMYVCIPGSIVIGIYIYQIEAAHIQHRDHDIAHNGGELPEEGKPKYEYQQIRKKPFPWGLQSFFFNPKANYPAEL
ncbi:unnamed protein product [Sympodiomycopsis kandeliae]